MHKLAATQSLAVLNTLSVDRMGELVDLVNSRFLFFIDIYEFQLTLGRTIDPYCRCYSL